MDYDAFTAGVEPGGLRRTGDIKILLCWLLQRAGVPLTAQFLTRSLTEQGLANYFEIGDALAALRDGGNIAPVEDGYVLTESGYIIATRLEDTLPLSVRERASAAVSHLLGRERSARENPVGIRQLEEGGCRIVCRVEDGVRTLMEVSLLLPDRAQAEQARDAFQAGPARVYRGVLSLLMGGNDENPAQQ